MTIPLKPLGDRIVAVKEEAQPKTAAGIILPDSAKEKSSSAKVEAVGKDVENVEVGDIIVYKEYTATEIKVEGTKYLLIREEDILATIA